jgi:hypothetical protein
MLLAKQTTIATDNFREWDIEDGATPMVVVA